ncbi:MAG: GDSL-type esterase/lipase family protein [Pseudomonadota bacterium]
MKAKTHFLYFLLLIFFLQTILVSVAASATRIMPLGDSITQGYIDGLTPENERVGYREKLYSDLVDEGHDVDFVGSQENGLFADPWHEGYNGWTADEIRDSVYSWLEVNPADIVLLHIGTNDISGGQSAADVRDEINEILNEIGDYEFDYSTEVMVILALIINREDPSSLEGVRTTQLNFFLQSLVNTRYAAGDQIRAVDHENALIYPNDMADPLHPNMTGYHKMADVWFSALEQILPDPDPPNNPNSDDSGCFISTATYGLDMEPHVKAPVDFRDHFLLTNFVGRALVDLYHSIRHLRQISTLDVFIK